MTSPPETIRVLCPECGVEYDDWTRSVNLDLGGDGFSEEYLRQCETATCPACGHVVEIGGVLRVDGGVWRWS